MNNPINLFKNALRRASAASIRLPNAMCLSTVSSTGRPSSRMMLLKGADARGFVFYTNLKSRKAKEFFGNPNVSLCFSWIKLQKQVRIEGRVKRVSETEADAYFTTRPRGSQIGAWASDQSETLAFRKTLLARAKAFEKKFKGRRVPRPPFWSGFVVIPSRIEFWHGRPDRLHERYLYEKKSGRWTAKQLYP